MKQIFDFGNLESNEKAILNTWNDFKLSLRNKEFVYTDIEKAKQTTFLRVFDDLFNNHNAMSFVTTHIGNLTQCIGRGTKLRETEIVTYERFIPKEEFITEDNRFSPAGVEWLYLAIENKESVINTVQKEIRVEKGDRFGFCYFEFDKSIYKNKIIDLTIADENDYEDFNNRLESFSEELIEREVTRITKKGDFPNDKHFIDKNEFVPVFLKWTTETYCKLLSEQIFVPLKTDDKNLEYAPFQTLSQYFISNGYSGIIYKSTVCKGGKNIVLFDKTMAYPNGDIIDIII